MNRARAHLPRTRGLRVGWLPGLFAGATLLYTAVVTAGSTVVSGAVPLPWGLSSAPVRLGLIAALVATFTLMTALAVATSRRARWVQRGTRGRGRLLAMTTTGLSHALIAILTATAVGIAFSRLATNWPDPFVLQEWLLSLPDPFYALLPVLLGLALFSLLALNLVVGTTWFLLPEKFRRYFWLVVDLLLLATMVFVTWRLPLRPDPASTDDPTLPAIRLAVTIAFSLRLIVRLLPRLLDLIERLGFQPYVAARLLRARKSNFLTTIGLLSVLAVSVSSCALTTTLSVMGGFRNDLKRKILGNSAHVVIDRGHGPLDRWVPLLKQVRSAERVVAASPYVGGEVMVTSATNLAGGVLRGIDVDSASKVLDLKRNLVRGKLAYLTDPKALLELPSDDDTEFIPLDLDLDPKSASTGSRKPLEDEARDDLKSFLKAPEPATPAREVLPGIVVGQELARSLRLFVGDDVNVVSPLGELGPSGPMPKSRSFRVAGIFYSGMYEYDMKYAYVRLSDAQRFLNAGETITGIEIKVEDVEQAPLVAEHLRASVARSDIRIQDWQERNRNLFGALELEKLAMFIALGMAILVAGFCVFGTLTLMVQEKGREVGILKALGTHQKTIVSIFLIEGLLIGALGAALGLGLGYVACFAAEHFGIRMNPEVYYIDKLPVHIDSLEFTAVGVAAVGVCVLATIFPAVIASRTRPVEALRFE